MWLIKLGTGITMIVFGVNQAHYPEKWLHFMPPYFRKTKKVKPTDIMRTHALGNILLGLFLIFPLQTHLSSALAFLWWLSIIPFVWKVSWQLALRDISITLGLGALFLLS